MFERGKLEPACWVEILPGPAFAPRWCGRRPGHGGEHALREPVKTSRLVKALELICYALMIVVVIRFGFSMDRMYHGKGPLHWFLSND